MTCQAHKETVGGSLRKDPEQEAAAGLQRLDSLGRRGCASHPAWPTCLSIGIFIAGDAHERAESDLRFDTCLVAISVISIWRRHFPRWREREVEGSDSFTFTHLLLICLVCCVHLTLRQSLNSIGRQSSSYLPKWEAGKLDLGGVRENLFKSFLKVLENKCNVPN